MAEDTGQEVQNTGTEIPGELPPGEAQKTPDQLAVESAETEARKQGWRPKEEFGGAEGAWVDAQEFLRRAPFFERIKDQSKHIKKLSDTVEALVRQQETTIKSQVELRLRQLKEQKREAIERQDVEGVDAIDAEIAREQANIQQTSQNSVPSYVTEWTEKNKWFTENDEMNKFAVAYNKTAFEKHGDPERSLNETEKAVKRAFPEYFKTAESAPPAAPTPPSPDGGGEPKGGEKGKGYNVNRLTADQKLVYEQQVKRFGILSHDEYFQGLEQIGELQ